MGWDEIKGQESALGFLQRSLASGRLAHAYLFHGPEGVGKRMAALLTARVLLCRGKDRPCDVCPACRQVRSGTHPDLHQAFPVGKSRRIRIEQVRRMLEASRLNSNQGGWKVFILDDAETMGAEGGNALLKFLEEPSSGTLIILVSYRPDQLLPTIVSRCQSVRFGLWPDSLLHSEALSSRASDLTAPLLASLAEGSPGRLMGLLEGDWLEGRSLILDLRTRCGQGESPGRLAQELLAFVKEQEKKVAGETDETVGALPAAERRRREEARIAAQRVVTMSTVLEILQGWYRDLYLFRNGAGRDIIINRDRIEEFSDSSAQESSPTTAFRALEAARESLLRRNASAPLVFERLFYELQGSRDSRG